MKTRILVIVIFMLGLGIPASSQRGGMSMKWSVGGSSYTRVEKEEIVQYTLPENVPVVLASKQQLTPKGSSSPLAVSYYAFSNDQQKVLVFTNTRKVWRLKSKGDYWILDKTAGTLTQLGKGLPASSLMFAKFSPDGKMAAYVSGSNIYSEDLASGQIKPLTTDGTITLINGTFDWAYEEEFSCRDGFRWSPDSRSIAYWQIDAGSIKKFNMINTTDSIYAQVIPIEYPKVGESPSAAKLGVVDISSAKTTWMKVPGDPAQNYLVRLEYIPFTGNLLVQQLNRKQNNSKLYILDPATGNAKVIQEESDEAWVDMHHGNNTYALDYTNNFIWLTDTKSILWTSEKDGWRHLYQVSLEGKPEKLITRGNYDVIELKYTNQKEGFVYFMASPDNATQSYLYKIKMNGKGNAELLSPATMKGRHDYTFSGDGKYASHNFSNHFTIPASEMISMPDQKPLNDKESIASKLDKLQKPNNVEFFRITTKDSVTMDGWMAKPKNFDPKKKYPVVFYVYTEPASATVSDSYGAGRNFLYAGDMAEDGYIYLSVDNRGTPAPKGRAWRKSIYRKVGLLNIHDQAMAATEILKWDFVDPERVAVWGWSGGGSATLNLLFQYPDIYKTGIAIAAVGNQLTYDNIYQERYMGLPQENRADFVNGSPITYAKNLKGNLLYIHGTGDDNVHYQNAEMLINELVKYNKLFQIMPYPNRTHSISEGEGTSKHLSNLYTTYLKQHCPPGGK